MDNDILFASDPNWSNDTDGKLWRIEKGKHFQKSQFFTFWFSKIYLTWSFQNKPLILFELKPFFDYYNDVAGKMELRVNLFW